jgi:hypothetical protein
LFRKIEEEIMGKWKRAISITSLSLLTLLIIGMECPKNTTPEEGGDVPGHVMNLEIASWWDGTSVHLLWDEPTLGSSVISGYRVYFRAMYSDDFAILANDITDEFYIHDTYDHESHVFRTGQYLVVAFNDEGEGESVDTASSIPVADGFTMWELDAPQVRDSYGFDRENGEIREYYGSFLDADSADLYLSDLQSSGYTGPLYHFVSMHYNDSIPADSADFPEAPWRVTGFYDWGSEKPIYVPSGLSYESIVTCQEGNYYIVQTEDGYYASIEVFVIHCDEGEIIGTGRFQLVRGLRLLQRP